MIKEIKTEETLGLFVTFLSLVTFQLGVGAGPLPPLGTPMFWEFGFRNQKAFSNL